MKSLTGKIDTPEKMKENLIKADVVVFHRPETEGFYTLAKELKENGKKIVIDNDDTFKIEDHHPLAQFKPDAVEVGLKYRNDAMDKMLSIADMATTSTEFLAKEYRKINDNVVVLPNSVDPMDWDEPLKNDSQKVRIGMVGSVAYEYDYLHMKDTLRELSGRDDVQLVLFGLGSKEHREQNPKITRAFQDEYDFWDSLDLEQIPWCPIEDYQETLNEARLDMMLIPRKENYFNKCKSNVKVLEAAMCEIPCLVQSFEDGPYEKFKHYKTVVKIKTSDQWKVEIDWMIKKQESRREIGINAKKHVLRHYNIENTYKLWAKAYKELYDKRD